ncbi:MAG TPA: HEAT repeat domain-containing protein, partial [Vicinamibacterales bacterium]
IGVLLFLIGVPFPGSLPAHAAQEPEWDTRPLSHWIRAFGAPATRSDASRALAGIATRDGGAAIRSALPILIESLAADVADVRIESANLLALMGPPATDAVPRLASLFREDESPRVRLQAGLALASIAPDDAAVVEASAGALRDADVEVRRTAAALLVQARDAAAPATAAIAAARGDEDPLVRLFAAAAQGQLGDTAAAREGLLEALADDDPVVRSEAAWQLGAALPPGERTRVIQPLTAALRDPDARVRLAAADALATIGRPARPAVDTLWTLVRDPDESVRSGALRAIKAIKD